MPRMKQDGLAGSLKQIAATGERVEAAATTLLAAIKREGLTSLGAFDDAVKAAFEANGWNTRPGRPAKDRRNVPHSVRTYVWEIRSAYRVGVEVWTLRTMYEVRMAKRALQDAERVETTGDGEEPTAQPVIPPECAQDLEGVRVLDVKRPNGALFHDLIATFIALKQEDRVLFGRQLARILHRYQPTIGGNGDRKAA